MYTQASTHCCLRSLLHHCRLRSASGEGNTHPRRSVFIGALKDRLKLVLAEALEQVDLAADAMAKR